MKFKLIKAKTQTDYFWLTLENIEKLMTPCKYDCIKEITFFFFSWIIFREKEKSPLFKAI